VKSAVPAVFARAVAGGDQRWAEVLWNRPVPQLGDFTPREYWEGVGGLLTTAVRQQFVVRVLRQLNGRPVTQLPDIAPANEPFSFDEDNGISLDGLALGVPVIRTPRARTLPSYRPRVSKRWSR
jgi:hypothetical protein